MLLLIRPRNLKPHLGASRRRLQLESTVITGRSGYTSSRSLSLSFCCSCLMSSTEESRYRSSSTRTYEDTNSYMRTHITDGGTGWCLLVRLCTETICTQGRALSEYRCHYFVGQSEGGMADNWGNTCINSANNLDYLPILSAVFSHVHEFCEVPKMSKAC